MPEESHLSMNDQISVRLSLDAQVHCYDPDTLMTFCGTDTEPMIGCMPVDFPMCEECVVATMVGLELRKRGV